MKEYRLAEVEQQFADIIWDHEPLKSTELVHLCEEQLQWKKSTTYTVLKKLCERGIFQNENAIVTARISREEFESKKSRKFVEESFGGSLPKFLTAFMGEKKLSAKEAGEIRKLIEAYQEKGE